ncbi:FAD-binding protein [Actinoplanes lobatus]|uniref:FAD-binding protein n=1 Tax=Actinoplanes lobatus TaxID=113568 RepID=A0ABQ4AIW8_9ACTN|nr:FAD-binding protein [Actinoplanes lobatus]GIE40953.1 FAD-binding protein [Actinoplanes lobatus]
MTAAGALALGSATTLAVTRWAGQGAIPATSAPGALLDDASRINPTSVRGVLFADPSPERTARTVAPLLRRIATGDDPAMAVAGVRHSMGGQSMLAGGWVLDTRPMNRIDLDRAAAVVRVGAGATWRELIPVLNEAGFSPKVMQSNHDFSIGGSLSVNCHGWHASHPPIASTVRRIRLLTAEGDVLTCSPTENAELFALALGGYGLYGVILEADLEVWPNAIYEPHFESMPTSEYATRFAARTSEMAYGRLSVDPLSFLEEAILVRFTPEAGTAGTVLPLTSPAAPELQRAIFRNSVGSGVGKTLRWTLEREAAPWLAAPMSRNTIQNQPAAVFADHSPDSSDILHEYFVPRARLWEFVRAARDLIAPSGVDLLNVTVRDVRADGRTTLAYAREDVFGLVMNFRQEHTARADDRMRDLTRALIDAVAAAGGTFYLPYRLHATAAQLRRAYPAWDAAMAAKRRLDPNLVFRNGLFEAYGR